MLFKPIGNVAARGAVWLLLFGEVDDSQVLDSSIVEGGSYLVCVFATGGVYLAALLATSVRETARVVVVR